MDNCTYRYRGIRQEFSPFSYENEDFRLEGNFIDIADSGTNPLRTYHQLRLHRHPLYEAHITLKGSCTYELQSGDVLTVPAGSFVIFPPEEPHRVFSESGSFSKLLLYYSFTAGDTDQGHSYAEAIGLLRPVKVYPTPPELGTLVNRILRLRHEPSLDPRVNLLFLFMTIHGSLLDTVINCRNRNPRSQDVRVAAATAFIQDNISAALLAEQTAEAVGLSGKQLNRLFQKELGVSVGAYMASVRHSRSCALLRNPAYSMQKVTELLQYSDYYSFSRAFKRVEGITPSQYRKTTRRDPDPDNDP